MSRSHSTTRLAHLPMQVHKLPDGSYWAIASDNGTLSYDRHGKARPLTAEAHRGAAHLWPDKPLTGNHKRLGRASNQSPIGIVHQGRVDERGQLILRFTPHDPRAAELLDANLHEGFSLGVRITGIAIRQGQEHIVAYEPDHLTVAFYPERPSCPKGVCDIVPPDVGAGAHADSTTSTEKHPMSPTPAPETPPTETPVATPATPPATHPSDPADAPPTPAPPAAPPAAPAQASASTTPPPAQAPSAPPAPPAAAPASKDGCRCEGGDESDSTLRTEIEQKDAQLASMRAQLEEYEKQEREKLLAEIGQLPEGVNADAKTLSELRELSIILTSRKSTSTEAPAAPAPPQGSGAAQTPVTPPAPAEDPQKKAIREAAEQWQAQKARYKLL